MSKWHSGPPPHVGWWHASSDRNKGLWRWWNGVEWSEPCHELRSANQAAERAGKPSCLPGRGQISWTDYWPANARVPRIDPSKA